MFFSETLSSCLQRMRKFSKIAHSPEYSDTPFISHARIHDFKRPDNNLQLHKITGTPRNQSHLVPLNGVFFWSNKTKLHCRCLHEFSCFYDKVKPVDRLKPPKRNIPSRTKLCFWWWNSFKYATLIHLLTLDYFPCQLFFFAEMMSWERSHGTLVVHHSLATIFLLPYIIKNKHSLLKRYHLYTLTGPDFARDFFLLSPLTSPRSPRMTMKFPVLWW